MEEELILNQEVFNKELIKHKKLIAKLGNILRIKGEKLTPEQKNALFTPVMRTGKELALASARLRCEKTGSTENLQFHHLIGRNNKFLMPFYKYATQRHYWANIIVLAQKYHKGNHSEELVISESLIKKVRKKYFK
jgi:hypothetical protein